MRIYFNPDGNVRSAVVSASILTCTKKTASFYDVDEIEENETLITDVLRTQKYKDENGDTKYYLDTGQLYERDNWTPYFEGP